MKFITSMFKKLTQNLHSDGSGPISAKIDSRDNRINARSPLVDKSVTVDLGVETGDPAQSIIVTCTYSVLDSEFVPPDMRAGIIPKYSKRWRET